MSNHKAEIKQNTKKIDHESEAKESQKSDTNILTVSIGLVLLVVGGIVLLVLNFQNTSIQNNENTPTVTDKQSMEAKPSTIIPTVEDVKIAPGEQTPPTQVNQPGETIQPSKNTTQPADSNDDGELVVPGSQNSTGSVG